MSLADRIAADEFIALERVQLRWLCKALPKQPRHLCDIDELRATVRFWALEAAAKYDPERGSFPPFLKTHLRLRSMSYAKYSRRRIMQPLPTGI